MHPYTRKVIKVYIYASCGIMGLALWVTMKSLQVL